MLAFIRKRYKQLILSFRYYYAVVSDKIKTPFGIGVIFGFFLYTGVSYYALNILVGLVYDDEVAEIIDLRFLIFLPMLLSATIYLNLVMMVKIFWDRLRRSPGTLLRFRIIGFFFLSIVLPAILFIFVFDIFFDRSIAIFDDQAILRTMENKKWFISQEVHQIQEQSIKEFDHQLNTRFSNFYQSRLSYIGVYDAQGSRRYYFKKNNFSLQQIPSFFFNTLLLDTEDRFTSYDMERGLVYHIRRTVVQGEIRYYAVIRQVRDSLRKDIEETFSVIRQVKQFELLLYPFKIFTIIFLIYVYLQVFSILAIVFYYNSNRYISPIGELIRATRQIIQGNYRLSLHRLTKHMGNNEIKELLESFSRMTQELLNYRRRLERISNIEAWKDVSQKLAHEIKNPLTPILLAKEQIEKHLIKTDIQGYHEMRENFLFIENEIKRILNLLDEFNILTQQRLIQLEWVHTAEILKNLERLLSNYSFIKWIGENRCQKPVFLDKEKIMRVLFNLARNAIDSLNELRERGVKREYTVKVIIYIEDIKNSKGNIAPSTGFKNVVFEVWDNGIGIPLEKRNDIFKPYVTFKSKGTGLGLAICDEIITLHQGEIENFSLPQEDERSLEKTTDDPKTNPLDKNDYWTVFRIIIPFRDKTD